jgi:hypothetical protein
MRVRDTGLIGGGIAQFAWQLVEGGIAAFLTVYPRRGDAEAMP